jgi:hypothetical protein
MANPDFSILFDQPAPPLDGIQPPACLRDLNLDQIIEAATAPKKDYDLQPFFYRPLADAKTIVYRQEVARDLQDKAWMAHIGAFAEKMAAARRYRTMAEKLNFEYHKKGWFLESALTYCEAVEGLAEALQTTPFASRGLQGLREYVLAYVQSPAFRSLASDARQVKAGLAAVKYSVIIQTGRFSVRRYEEETDYSIEVEKTFARFKQGAVKDYRVNLYTGTGMNHIEAKILEFVVRLYPEPFAALDRFCERHAAFMDATLLTFDREVQFYVAYLDYIAPLQEENGLHFCFPEMSEARQVEARDAFDLALAASLRYEGAAVVLNDFELRGAERILVVTGPNQGGKTTFARMFGQLHYLAALGLPVPARQARLALFDHLLTHFERQEDIRTLRGKLQDDVTRLYDLLQQASPRSIFLFNEIFSSTTLKDALFLSRKILARLVELDALGVWVTFLDELAAFNEKTVSMVSTVVPENPAERTFKIVRRPADGLAYALSLAEKHRLTRTHILERIRP